MTIKEKIKENSALQYVVNSLETLSPVGHRQLLNQPLLHDPDSLNEEWTRIETTMAATTPAAHRQTVIELRHQLMCLHDIQRTLSSLKNHQVMDEVELFEIKSFAHLVAVIRRDLCQLGMDSIVQTSDLGDVFDILDPDGTGIANFYIYDSYDPRLGPLRKELKAIQLSASPDDTQQQSAIAALLDRQDAIQHEVLQQLSDRLQPYASRMQDTLEQCGYCDLLLAKAQQAADWGLCRPTIGDAIDLQGLVHPQLQRHHLEQGLRYQPVDLQVRRGACLITGANMAGKTVLLKALGCAQLMAQFGMFVAAKKASLPLFDDVVCCIGDEQDEMQGLSSYAAEITRISHALQRSRTERLLLLIDEPARTTNPVEGCALVRAIATILDRQDGIALVTTHYSGLGLDCQRLRVRGFDERLSDQRLNASSINQFIDYSLVADDSDEVPHEALRIAELLGCDEEMITLAQTSAAQ